MGIYAVTGAGSGIGLAIASSLRKQGHHVISVDIKEADVIADLSSEAGRDIATNRIQELAPDGLDGLVPCAGVGPQVTPHSLIAKINYFGVVHLVENLKEALSRKKGSVLIISSNSAWTMPYSQDYIQALLDMDEAKASAIADTLEGQACYGGSKQAVGRWMRRNVHAYTRLGIRINALAPGYTLTPQIEVIHNDPEFRDAMTAYVESIPAGRPGHVQDQVTAANFLLSPEASYISGSVLYVDGGHDASIRPDQF